MRQTTDKTRMSLFVTHSTSVMVLQLGMALFVSAFVSRILQACSPQIQSQTSIKVGCDLNLVLDAFCGCTVLLRPRPAHWHSWNPQRHTQIFGRAVTSTRWCKILLSTINYERFSFFVPLTWANNLSYVSEIRIKLGYFLSLSSLPIIHSWSLISFVMV